MRRFAEQAENIGIPKHELTIMQESITPLSRHAFIYELNQMTKLQSFLMFSLWDFSTTE